MRYLLILLLAILSPVALLANEDSTAITHVFIHPAGKSSVTVLQLRQSGRYDYCRYTSKRIYHDHGVFQIRRGKIIFESKIKKREGVSLDRKTYFINKKGLFHSRVQAMTGSKSVLKTTTDAEYMNTWTYNPLTGKDEAAEKKAKAEEAAKKTAADKAFSPANYIRNYYLNLTGDYASPYKAILDKSYSGPDSYKTTVNGTEKPWDKDTNAAVLFSSFETVIHESVHRYNATNAVSGKELYVIEPGLEIQAERTTVFASSEIKKFAPADASTKIFRYETYVSDKSAVSANTMGIFGLLDEFSAYHSGVKACVLAAHQALQKGDTAKAEGFVKQASQTYFAYYEFNLFMAWYLRTAKANHPETYKELMANSNLRVAYTLLDAEFKTTNENLTRVSAIIEKKTGRDSMEYYEKTYAAYPKKLVEKEKGTLDAFRVKGVTKGNYFTFLK
jgi:hypothetical protein